MAKLKYTIENEKDLDALDEGIRGLYEKSEDGTFRLSVENVVPKKRHDEFRQSNIELTRERDHLTQLLSKHVPQEKLDEMATELAQQRTQELAAKLTRVMIDKQITSLALAHGARPDAVDDITQRASRYFKISDNGDLVPLANPGPDGALTGEQFVDALKKSHSYYFAASSGGGAAGNRDTNGRFKGDSKIRFKDDLKTAMEKSEFIKERGFSAFEELPLRQKPSPYQRWQTKEK